MNKKLYNRGAKHTNLFCSVGEISEHNNHINSLGADAIHWPWIQIFVLYNHVEGNLVYVLCRVWVVVSTGPSATDTS